MDSVTIMKVVQEAGFKRCEVGIANYDNFQAYKLVVPIKHNGVWNGIYRARLDVLCKKLSDAGFRWAAEYPAADHLATSNEKGEPWMLFNGGEVVDLITVEQHKARYS